MLFHQVSKFVLAFMVVFLIAEINCEDCGQSYSGSSEMMSSEKPIEGAWPWMVALIKQEGSKRNEPICSGFLIDSKNVLTAAHCFEGRGDGRYSVRIGSINLKKGKEYFIHSIVKHPGYKSGMFYDDLAILTLERAVDFPNFNPVCLPDEIVSRKNLTKIETTVVGLASEGSFGPVSNVLKQRTEIPVMSTPECDQMYQKMTPTFLLQFPRGLDSGFICAGFQAKNVCEFRSGAPLMYEENNRWFAVGVLNFGYSCGTLELPTGFTRVSNYLDWIRKNTRD